MDDLEEALNRAKMHHRAGQLLEAERLYRQVLATRPDDADVWFLLGIAYDALGQTGRAIDSVQNVTRLRPERAEAHNFLGALLAQEDRLDEAITCFEQACRLRPEWTESTANLNRALASRHNRQGLSLAAEEKWEAAAACYIRALELLPDLADAHTNLGTARAEQGASDVAEACFRRALELQPEAAGAHANLGTILRQQGKLASAADSYRRALSLDPDMTAVVDKLVGVLLDQDLAAEAESHCRRALEFDADRAENHANLGAVKKHLGQLDEAAACYERALALRPEYPAALVNLGNVLRHQDQLDEAVALHRRAIELQPDYPVAHYNLAFALAGQNKLNEVSAAYDRAVELDPDYAEAHFGRALLWLERGQFTEGWPEYEWRFRRKGRGDEPLVEPRWQGEPLAGRTILLRREQGHGDTIQFIRFAEQLKQRGARVIVQCQPALARLVAGCAGVDSVIADGDPRPAFDFHVPLLSLPGILGTSLATIPVQVPYLEPDAELAAHWKRELSDEPAFKIGIAWQGNPTFFADRARSFPLAHFGGIAEMPGVRLYSLQMHLGREQLPEYLDRWPIVDLGDRLGDFYNTAAIVRNLDLVISSDSAPVHLAGALGVPVWTALAFSPDWRWMLERTDSPWYPTMRLFRQQRPGDWQGVFHDMEQALAQRLQTGEATS